MTPFGLRKKLKGLLGMGGGSPSRSSAPPRPQLPKVTIHMIGPDEEEQTCQAEAGSTLVYGTANLAKPLGTGCADATCGTCRVEVLEGEENLFPQDESERAVLKANQFPEHLRLGCQLEVRQGEVKVRAYEYAI